MPVNDDKSKALVSPGTYLSFLLFDFFDFLAASLNIRMSAPGIL
jgi:hypothetical protein